jgi:hypothetical protein
MISTGVIKNSNSETEFLANIEGKIVLLTGVQFAVKHNCPAAIGMPTFGFNVKA